MQWPAFPHSTGLFALLLGRCHRMQRGKPRPHRREASLDNGIAQQRALGFKRRDRLLELFPLAHPVCFRRPAGTHGPLTRLTRQQ